VDEQTEATVELWVVRIEWRREDDEARAWRGRGGDGVALSLPRLHGEEEEKGNGGGVSWWRRAGACLK